MADFNIIVRLFMSKAPRIEEFEDSCKIFPGMAPRNPYRFGRTTSANLPPALIYIYMYGRA